MSSEEEEPGSTDECPEDDDDEEEDEEDEDEDDDECEDDECDEELEVNPKNDNYNVKIKLILNLKHTYQVYRRLSLTPRGVLSRQSS